MRKFISRVIIIRRFLWACAAYSLRYLIFVLLNALLMWGLYVRGVSVLSWQEMSYYSGGLGLVIMFAGFFQGWGYLKKILVKKSLSKTDYGELSKIQRQAILKEMPIL